MPVSYTMECVPNMGTIRLFTVVVVVHLIGATSMAERNMEQGTEFLNAEKRHEETEQ